MLAAVLAYLSKEFSGEYTNSDNHSPGNSEHFFSVVDFDYVVLLIESNQSRIAELQKHAVSGYFVSCMSMLRTFTFLHTMDAFPFITHFKQSSLSSISTFCPSYFSETLSLFYKFHVLTFVFSIVLVSILLTTLFSYPLVMFLVQWKVCTILLSNDGYEIAAKQVLNDQQIA